MVSTLRTAVLALLVIAASSPRLPAEETGAKALFRGEDGSTQMVRATALEPPVASPAKAAQATVDTASGPARPRTSGTARTSNPTTQPKAKADLGIKIAVELVGTDGSAKGVPLDHVFVSGDRVRLVVASSTDGFLYVSNRGSSGKVTRLYPLPGMEQPMVARTEYTLPGTIRFDENPGEEMLMVMVAKEPLPDDSPYLGAPEQHAANAKAAFAGTEGSKDLVFEVETSPSPALYAVSKAKESSGPTPIALIVPLRHE